MNATSVVDDDYSPFSGEGCDPWGQKPTYRLETVNGVPVDQKIVTPQSTGKKIKVIVAGSRNFTDRKLMFEKLDTYLGKRIEAGDEVIILSGTAKGADQLGEEYAHFRKLKVERYPAEWDKYGKSAGYKRNEKMSRFATHLVAFWDGQSKGTRHMINIAKDKGLTVRVVNTSTDSDTSAPKVTKLPRVEMPDRNMFRPKWSGNGTPHVQTKKRR